MSSGVVVSRELVEKTWQIIVRKDQVQTAYLKMSRNVRGIIALLKNYYVKY